MPDPLDRRTFAATFAASVVLGREAVSAEAPAVAPVPHPRPVEAAFERDYPAPGFNPRWQKPQINRLLVQDFVIYAHMDTQMVSKLLDKEPESRADLPASFVLLREARDLAASVGDVEIAFGAIDRMDEVFQIDAPPMKVRVLEAAARRATAPDAAKALGDAYARLVEDLVSARAFESAKAAALKGEAFAKSSKQPALATQIKSKAAEIDRLLKEEQELKAAQKTGWREVPGQPEATPAQTAVLIWELFRETARDPESKKRGEDFAMKLANGEKAAGDLRAVLGDAAQPEAARDAALERMTQACAMCHKAHRN